MGIAQSNDFAISIKKGLTLHVFLNKTNFLRISPVSIISRSRPHFLSSFH